MGGWGGAQEGEEKGGLGTVLLERLKDPGIQS